MNTTRINITNRQNQLMPNTQGLTWGNNASWICISCGVLLGNRTGDNDFNVDCSCGEMYSIIRVANQNGNLSFGPAVGVRLR